MNIEKIIEIIQEQADKYSGWGLAEMEFDGDYISGVLKDIILDIKRASRIDAILDHWEESA